VLGRDEDSPTSGRVFQFHVAQAQLFSTDQFGVRMVALRAGRFPASSIEIVTAILAVVANRQDFDKKLRALSDGAARGFSKHRAQAIGIEDAPSSNGKTQPYDSIG
jgi:hypothetical protein